MKLTVMCGIPNSGKTTLAARLSEESGAIVFRFDDYARGIKTQSDQDRVLNTVLGHIREALTEGNDVIYDTVNGTVSSRKTVLDYFADMEGLEIVCAYVDTPADICISRDRSGWSSVFARSFVAPTAEEGFDRVDTYHNDPQPEPEAEPSELDRIEALEAIIQAQADALERLGVIPDA